MIRGGTTTFVDMYYYPDTIADVIESCGMRALISATVIDQRSPDAEGASDSISNGEGFIDRWQNRHPRITPIFGPQHGVAISIHVSESAFESQYSKDNYGKTSIEMLDEIGFFEGPTIAAHVVWPTATEIPILRDRKGVSGSVPTARPVTTISTCGKRCAWRHSCRKSPGWTRKCCRQAPFSGWRPSAVRRRSGSVTKSVHWRSASVRT
jgi:5-methylthioadenosine/S-adenosylhomocysteine deaminase